jgi:uncharacterized protein YbjT (DUF2867 family)
LNGIDKMFLLIGNVAREFTQAVTAYGLARRVGVKHIAYLSVLQGDRFLDVPHFASEVAIEQTITTESDPVPKTLASDYEKKTSFCASVSTLPAAE